MGGPGWGAGAHVSMPLSPTDPRAALTTVAELLFAACLPLTPEH